MDSSDKEQIKARAFLDSLVEKATRSKLEEDLSIAIETSIVYARNLPTKDFEEVLEVSDIIDKLRELRLCQS